MWSPAFTPRHVWRSAVLLSLIGGLPILASACGGGGSSTTAPDPDPIDTPTPPTTQTSTQPAGSLDVARSLELSLPGVPGADLVLDLHAASAAGLANASLVVTQGPNRLTETTVPTDGGSHLVLARMTSAETVLVRVFNAPVPTAPAAAGTLSLEWEAVVRHLPADRHEPNDTPDEAPALTEATPFEASLYATSLAGLNDLADAYRVSVPAQTALFIDLAWRENTSDDWGLTLEILDAAGTLVDTFSPGVGSPFVQTLANHGDTALDLLVRLSAQPGATLPLDEAPLLYSLSIASKDFAHLPAPVIRDVRAPETPVVFPNDEASFEAVIDGEYAALDWQFDEGAILVGEDADTLEPQVRFRLPGAYTGTLTATGYDGSTVEQEFGFDVSPAPIEATSTALHDTANTFGATLVDGKPAVLGLQSGCVTWTGALSTTPQVDGWGPTTMNMPDVPYNDTSEDMVPEGARSSYASISGSDYSSGLYVQLVRTEPDGYGGRSFNIFRLRDDYYGTSVPVSSSADLMVDLLIADGAEQVAYTARPEGRVYFAEALDDFPGSPDNWTSHVVVNAAVDSLQLERVDGRPALFFSTPEDGGAIFVSHAESAHPVSTDDWTLTRLPFDGIEPHVLIGADGRISVVSLNPETLAVGFAQVPPGAGLDPDGWVVSDTGLFAAGAVEVVSVPPVQLESYQGRPAIVFAVPETATRSPGVWAALPATATPAGPVDWRITCVREGAEMPTGVLELGQRLAVLSRQPVTAYTAPYWTEIPNVW